MYTQSAQIASDGVSLTRHGVKRPTHIDFAAIVEALYAVPSTPIPTAIQS